MLTFLHAGGLTGESTDVWLRSMLRALARLGHTVHAVCGEAHPERFDFIAQATVYEPDGSVSTTLHRETAYPGRIVLHVPIGRPGATALRTDALFDAMAAVVAGHGPGVIVALGGQAAGRAAHRTQAALGVPYALVCPDAADADPIVLAGAVRVMTRLDPGVDATAVHPLHPSGRREQIQRFARDLALREADDRVAETLAGLEQIDWAEDRIIVSTLSTPAEAQCLTTAVRALCDTGTPCVVTGPLPISLASEWLPATDVLVSFDAGGAPGFLDAMAAGVVPVVTPEGGREFVADALAAGGRGAYASWIGLQRRAEVRPEDLTSALRHALVEGPLLRTSLRRAAVVRHDWHVVAAGLAEEFLELGAPRQRGRVAA